MHRVHRRSSNMLDPWRNAGGPNAFPAVSGCNISLSCLCQDRPILDCTGLEQAFAPIATECGRIWNFATYTSQLACCSAHLSESVKLPSWTDDNGRFFLLVGSSLDHHRLGNCANPSRLPWALVKPLISKPVLPYADLVGFADFFFDTNLVGELWFS